MRSTTQGRAGERCGRVTAWTEAACGGVGRLGGLAGGGVRRLGELAGGGVGHLGKLAGFELILQSATQSTGFVALGTPQVKLSH